MSFRFAARMNHLRRSFVREILKVTDRPDVISFAGGLPNAEMIPVEAIAAASEKVLRRDGQEALQYRTTEGYPPLREWIAGQYAARGVRVSVEEILITTGSQQGLDLLGKVLIDEGDEVVVEDPTYLAAIQSFGLYGSRFLPVRTDEDGAELGVLTDALGASPKLVYCMPDFQNPTGISYSAERRRRVGEMVRDSSAVLVEDDPYGQLRFRGEAQRSLAVHNPGRTVMLGSFSKTIAPGLRLGWVCAPAELMEKLVMVKQAADLHTEHLAQRVTYQFLADNDFERHLEMIRRTYKAHCDAMLEAIARYVPAGVQTTQPDGGMFLWMTLPGGVSAMDLFPLAVERGVAFVPGGPFHAGGGGENTLRLNFTNAEPKRIEAGIERLGAAIAELLGR
jgi:2-aminoadipate transaminase